MEITLERAEKKLSGTHWRPVQHQVEVRRQFAALHWMPEKRPTTRRKSGTRVGTYRMKREKAVLDGVDLLAAADQPYTPVKIESIYKRGTFVEGFVYVRALAAFLHEDVVGRFEGKTDQIGAGAVIHSGVTIEPEASVGSFTELEKGAKVLHGALVGPDSIIRKGAIVGEDAILSAHFYVGQFANIGHDVTPHSEGGEYLSNAMGVIESKVNIFPGVVLGAQDRIGKGSNVMDAAQLDDAVRIGRNVHMAGLIIGEMASVGDNSFIADRAVVGAEAHLASFVRVGPGAWLSPHAHIEEGAVIPGSQKAVDAGLSGGMFDALVARLEDN